MCDTNGGPRGQLFYPERFQNDIDTMIAQNWMKTVEGVVFSVNLSQYHSMFILNFDPKIGFILT